MCETAPAESVPMNVEDAELALVPLKSSVVVPRPAKNNFPKNAEAAPVALLKVVVAVKSCSPVQSYSSVWFTEADCHEGAVPSPFDVRNCPEVPSPVTCPIALVELPNRILNSESVVEPVPPFATAIVVPFQTPVVMVPIVARFESVVILSTEVVPMSRNPVLISAKLALSVVGKSLILSVLFMVVNE